MIRRAKIQELPQIMRLAKACALKMEAEGIYQWNENYPTATVFEADIQRNELYVLLEGDRVTGTVVLTEIEDAEYVPVKWLSSTGPNLYIHRLAVDPARQGRGNARRLMDYAESYAREQNYISVRLDTFSQNKRNQRFYEARGYEKLDDIFFPKQSVHPFHCYELML